VCCMQSKITVSKTLKGIVSGSFTQDSLLIHFTKKTMNNKLAGILFIMFGMGLLGDSIQDFSTDGTGLNLDSIKPILGILLGICSSIYGYKRMKMNLKTESKTP